MNTRSAQLWMTVFFVILCPMAANAGELPNIVFVLADDLGVNDLASYGRQDHRTPNLDRLAREGTRFTAAYCAQPICSPTRAAIMTGKAPARLHLTTFLPGRADAPSQLLLHPRIQTELPLEEKTLAERLKAAGYATGCVGKWHLGGQGFLPTDQGFDFYAPGRGTTTPSASEGGKGEYELTSAAEKFLEENRDRPFFLYLAHDSPHIPLAGKPELIEKNRAAFNPTYAAMIETLDDRVGRILEKLDALGIAGKTIVVFTSDNGGLHVLESAGTPATHNTPFRAGKGFCYEGGLRVPLIVRWPNMVKAGAVSDAAVISTDWVPTLLELAGLPPAEAIDGASFAGLLVRGEAPARRPLFWHFPHYTNQGSRPAGAVREGDWKLIEHYEDGRCELFDLAKDPGETTDVAAREPARVAELRGKLEAWRRAAGADRNTANPAFEARLWRALYADLDASRLEKQATAAAMATGLASWRKLMDEVLPAKNRKPAEPAGTGAIILEARNARVIGGRLRYEPEPHKDTLGFWIDPKDRVEWDLEVPRAGDFEVVVLQGCGAGSGGAEIAVAVAGQSLTMKVEETGHFQRFVPRSIGTVRIEPGRINQPGRLTLSVRALSKPGPAVMDLRRVILKSAR